MEAISLLIMSFAKRIISHGIIYLRSSYSFVVNGLSMDKHKTAQWLVSNYDNTNSLDRSWGQQILGGQQSARRDWWCVVGQAEVVEMHKLKSWARRTKCKLAWWRRTAAAIRFYCYSRTLKNFVLIICNYSHLYSGTFLGICTDHFICLIIL